MKWHIDLRRYGIKFFRSGEVTSGVDSNGPQLIYCENDYQLLVCIGGSFIIEMVQMLTAYVVITPG